METSVTEVVMTTTTTPETVLGGFTWNPVSWTWWIVVQLFVAVIGLVGNVTVIIVYTRKNRLKNATNMFIMALAVADTISSLVLIPLPKAKTTPNSPLGQFYCKVIFSNVILWVSIAASIFTLTTISVERYVAVVFPIKYRNFFTKSRPKFVILVIWVFSLLINCFSYYVSYRNPDTGECIADFGTPIVQALIGCNYFLFEYFIPMVIMISTQVITINRLRQKAKPLRGADPPGNKEPENAFMVKARRKVIKMLFIVVITFIVCWSPDQIAFFMFNLGFVEPQYFGGNLYQIFIVLAYANSCANPLIYTASHPQFRDALRQLLNLRMEGVLTFSRTSGQTENTSEDSPFPPGVDALEAQGGIIDLTDDGRKVGTAVFYDCQ